jgi:hypothetical protein
VNVPTERAAGDLFQPFIPAVELPIRVEYHIHTWSQNGAHIAALRTREPYALPLEISGETFGDFITILYHDEREFGFLTTLTWG